MENKNTYIIIAVIIVAIIGGYFILRPTPEPTPDVTEREGKWEEWSETLRVGVLNFDFHPGSFEIGSGIAARLFRYNTVPRLLWEDSTTSGQYNLLYAESWEYKTDEDGDVYVEFKIKPGMTYNDGTPITAQNVKYCWYRKTTCGGR